MSAFIDAMDVTNARILGENGAAEDEDTGSALVNLFFKAVRDLGDAMLELEAARGEPGAEPLGAPGAGRTGFWAGALIVVAVIAAHRREELHAIHVRHVEVDEHNVRFASGLEGCERLRPVRSLLDGEPVELESLPQDRPHRS